jgi:hypothetical protein
MPNPVSEQEAETNTLFKAKDRHITPANNINSNRFNSTPQLIHRPIQFNSNSLHSTPSNPADLRTSGVFSWSTYPPSSSAPINKMALLQQIQQANKHKQEKFQFTLFSTMHLVALLASLIIFIYQALNGLSAEQSAYYLLGSTILWCLFFATCVPRISQSQAYHNFADRRSLLHILDISGCACHRNAKSQLNIPNAFDVLSNLPFLFVGIHGLITVYFHYGKLSTAYEFNAWLVFFVGIVSVFFGSCYYHWNPNNHTLVWDRLPMTIGFMVLFAVVMQERLAELTNLGNLVTPPLLMAGFFSCMYWHFTDDLRPYILVQFYPLIIIPLLIAVFNPTYTQPHYYVYALILYALAKVTELLDSKIFAATKRLISGHSLKHILAAVAIEMLVLMLLKRDKINNTAAAK